MISNQIIAWASILSDWIDEELSITLSYEPQEENEFIKVTFYFLKTYSYIIIIHFNFNYYHYYVLFSIYYIILKNVCLRMVETNGTTSNSQFQAENTIQSQWELLGKGWIVNRVCHLHKRAFSMQRDNCVCIQDCRSWTILIVRVDFNVDRLERNAIPAYYSSNKWFISVVFIFIRVE